MRRLLPLPLVLLLFGCGALDSEPFTLGPPDLATVRLEAPLQVAALAEEGCTSSQGGAVRPVPDGCRLSVEVPAVPLLEPHAAEAAAERLRGLSGGTLDAVRTVSLVVRSLSLEGPEGALPLRDLGARVRVAVDGVDLLGELPPERLEAGSVRVVVPEPLRRPFAAALVSGRPLLAPIEVAVEVPEAALDALPAALSVVVVLQPEVEVAPVEPAFGPPGR